MLQNGTTMEYYSGFLSKSSLPILIDDKKVLPFLPFPPLDYVNTAALFVKIEIFPSYSVVSLYNISCKLKINNHIHSLCSY